MRLSKNAHTSRPWRVHEVTGDFELEDVWELPTPGGPDDLARLVDMTAAGRFADDREFPAAFRALFAFRWKLGEFFGWDKADSGVGQRVRSLRERLPADLLEAPRGPDRREVPGRTEVDGPPIFTSVYRTHDEWVSEIANRTVHSLMHIGWVPDDSGGGYHAQMAVLTKPNGWLGRAYMAAIKPFRHLVIYPALMRAIERAWQTKDKMRLTDQRAASARMKGQAPDRVRRVGVSDPIAAVRRHHYADAFELRLEGPDRCSPEEWLRAGVDATPAWIKRVAGARDGFGSARIIESDGDVVVLEDSDPLMDTVLVGRNLDPDRRVLTTILRYRRPLLARAVWAFVGILHRRTAPQVVAGGLRHERAHGMDPLRKRKLSHLLEKYVLNPQMRFVLRLGIAPANFALLKTTGRRSGRPRLTPVGNGLRRDTFWLVAEHGEHCHYVKNLLADPKVGVKVGRQWRTGIANPLPDDDGLGRRRLLDRSHGLGGRIDGAIFRATATQPLTIRIDLEPVAGSPRSVPA